MQAMGASVTFGEREVALSTGAGTVIGVLIAAAVKHKMPGIADMLVPPLAGLMYVFIWRWLGRPGGTS